MILLVTIALVLVVAIGLVGVSCLNQEEAGPPTAQVDRGRVALAVSASGSVAPAGQQNLGFADGGTVTDVFVRVGDRVEAGQVLARIDDTVARQTLAQRRATLAQQQATLDKIVTGNAVESAQATLSQAQQAEQATRAQADATNAANRSATSRARAQLRFDEEALDRAEDQLEADRSACASSPRTTTPRPAPAAAAAAPAAPAAGAGAVPAGGAAAPPAGGGAVPPGGQPVPTQPVPNQPVPTQPVPTQPTPTQPTPTQPTPTKPTQPTVTVTVPEEPEEPEESEEPERPSSGSDSGRSSGSDSGDGDSDGDDNSRSAVQRSGGGQADDDEESTPVVTTRVARLAASAPLDDLDDDLEDADERTSPACSRVVSDRQSVQQAQGAVVTARTSLEAAEQRERTDAAAGQVSIENARTSVVSAQNELATAGGDRPDDIAVQEAQVRDARAGVEIAQRDVEETVITAPVAGIVTALNGTAGEVVSPPSAVTSQAPGGTAPLPATSGGGGEGASAGGSAASGGSFLVLNSAEPFQLVVPFEEADAARILPGQAVDVAVDALPNDPLTGRVVSVAPSGQDISGIVSYYATVVVVGGADRLRDGQTAEANVRVEAVENTLRVPAAAVRREDGRPTVTVAGPDGEPVSRPFLAGLVGDDFVEVRSGLNDGDQVQLPQATVTPNTGQGGPPPSN
jgi:multidrug efflux pump subunit AcrA (membrane-fusion protein)